MGKEQVPRNDFQEEEKRAYEKTAISVLFVIGGAIASRHWPIAAAPTLIYCAESVRNYREYKKLTKLRDLASSISNLEKPEMSEEGKNEGLAQIQVAMWKKFRK